ncbi:type II secretion system protein [Nocardioides mangrovicus]|uniref:Type II secretion system protein n=2 Tax=Nocardioides mangrovicus TaxID=2478913 RepID=A0A3L8NZX3_9ACTN|nr:type II secretion system protein [Nocardioides mangrovicus]
MFLALMCGAVAGAGLYLVTRVFARPRTGVGTMLARIDSGSRSMSTHTITAHELAEGGQQDRVQTMFAKLADRFEVLAADRGWQLGRQRQDLALMSRTVGFHLASKAVTAVGLFLLAPVVWSILTLGGAHVPPVVPAFVGLIFALVGFLLPDVVLRSEAGERRRDFRRSVGVFLDLVAMNLAGGRGLPEALLAAASVGDHWSMVRIRSALANARLYGTTPWVALGDLGKALGVEELEELSGALLLAADDGAKIRSSLSARAATLRRRELTQAEGEEGEKSQSMLVAQMLISTAFMIFLGFPAVSQLLKA